MGPPNELLCEFRVKKLLLCSKVYQELGKNKFKLIQNIIPFDPVDAKVKMCICPMSDLVWA